MATPDSVPSQTQDSLSSQTLFGHPAGLFTLFFAEMWERFSFYGMKALLLFYMMKGFLSYGDKQAYGVLGAYMALVYMTPLFGGMIADRLLGARRAVVLGGLLMAAGHLLMSVQDDLSFFLALGLLITGNGFFKPNISTIVGTLYSEHSPKRDAGFTIFYMGVNLGAAASPLLCGYVGETYGWHWGFGLATIGMLTGLAVFVMPTRLTQVMIMAGAVGCAGGLFYLRADNAFSIGVNFFVGACLLIAGVIAWIALGRGGLPSNVGLPPDRERLRRRVLGPLSAEWLVYAGALVAIPVLAMLVSGFSPLTASKQAVSLIPEWLIERLQQGGSLAHIAAKLLEESSKPAGLILLLAGLGAAVFLGMETFRLSKVPRERMFVVFVLTFFSLAFWSFFEQASSSVNNFTDRNVDRVAEARLVTAADVGTTIRLRIPADNADAKLAALPVLTQEQLGYRHHNPALTQQIVAAIRSQNQQKANAKPEEIDKLIAAIENEDVLTMTSLTYLRGAAKEKNATAEQRTVDWIVQQDNVGMAIGGAETPASVYQAVNPVYILVFGVAFSALWGFLAVRGWEPSTPFKFALGLMQLGLAFVAFWYGATAADGRGMTAVAWLFLGYLLQTTGELCLSPVGLSMVTRMSPKHLVSTVMGSWFLATAFSEFLAAVIAQFTGVTDGTGGGAIPPPIGTVGIYGHVFGVIAMMALGSALICFALVPLLKRWMHENVVDAQAASEPEPALSH